MRKVLSLLTMLCLTLVSAMAQQTLRVQGVPRTVPNGIVLKSPKIAGGQQLDAAKVKYFVGEGDNTSYLMIDWCDGKGAQNLVWGYRWDDEDAATGEMMLRDIAKADPRFYMLVYGETQYGAAIGGLGFDLNGNQQVGLQKAGGEQFPVDEDGLVHTSQYDFDDYMPIDSTDHWASGWYSNGYWSYWTAENLSTEPGYSGVGATGRKLVDGSLDYWYFSSLTGEPAPLADYYFYVPEPVTGVALPDEITLPISDNCVLPVILGATGLEAKTFAWTIQNAEGKRDNTIISTIRSTAESFNGAVTFKGNKTGEVYVYVKPRIGGESYQSNTCKVTVTAPEKPITVLSFTHEEMELGLRQKGENPLIMTPLDATYTAVTYTSSNRDVASIGSSTGAIQTTSNEGTTTITATSTQNPEVTASFTLTVKCQKPVERIEFVDGDVITLPLRDIYCPNVRIIPEDADDTGVTYEIEDPSVASFYQANIVAHKVGETKMTVTARDGHGASTTVTVKVVEPDRTPFDGYMDGTFILNEAWFGHENGDMNFLTENDSLMYRVYERENPNEAFGATSCFGTIYGGKMYVTSKQPADGGDMTTNPGGRLVVMDANTLKKIAGLDEIGGGDGRSVVGVNPHKAYLGTTAGVVTFDIDNMTVGNVIEGTQGAILYTGQTGDMIKVGNYVFALQQSKGTHVIDAETDMVVKTIENSAIQGITQSADGSVWLAATDTLYCLNPNSLEIESRYALPEGASISCSWGAWRPTPFCASRTKNVLFWNGGSTVVNNGSAFYRWEIGTDIASLQPFFTLEGLPAASEGEEQISYGTIRYDDRDDELIVMTTQSGFGTAYEHNWIHLVNGTTGEINKSMKLKQYYWFPTLPVFPDKYSPEVDGLPAVVEFLADDAPFTYDVAANLKDEDNLACNITSTLADRGNDEVATVTFEDGQLTITSVAEGATTAVIELESNGVLAECAIDITVKTPESVDNVLDNARNIYALDGQVVVEGYDGWHFMLFDTTGRAVMNFTAHGDACSVTADACHGSYVLKGWHGSEAVAVKLIL